MRKLTIYTPNVTVFQPVIDMSRDTAIYIRQSDEKAAEKAPFSRASQMKLVDFAMALRGETDTDHIRIYDEKDGVSGQLPINKREKIKELYADIERGEIGSVIVIAADRLFRDQYGIQDGTFIKAAHENHVTVFVCKRPPEYTKYDCTRASDRAALDAEFRKARAYLDDHVFGKMIPAQEDKARMGLYYGQQLAPGYVVLKDADKIDQHLLVYEPWAEKVKWLSRRFKETDLPTVCREIEAMPYLYPEPSADDRQKYLFKVRATKVDGGYKPNREESIKATIINPTYLGMTIWKDQIVVVDSHPAILDKDEFMGNLYRLTGRDLYGNPVEGYRIRLRDSTPTQTVLKMVLTSPMGQVYTVRDPNPEYIIEEVKQPDKMRRDVLLSIQAENLDSIFIERLKDVARADKHLAEHIQASIKDTVEQHRANNASIQKSLEECRQKIAHILNTLKLLESTLTDEDKLELAKDLPGLRAQEKAILASQQKADDADLQKDYEELSDVLQDVAGTVDGCTIPRLQKLARLTTTKVVIEEMSIHWLKFTVRWRGPMANREDVALIWRLSGRRQELFSTEEDDTLRHMYPTSSILEICKMLPTRSPWQIHGRAKELELKRMVKRSMDLIPRHSCWQDIEVIGDRDRAEKFIRSIAPKNLLTAFWLYSPGIQELEVEVANMNREGLGSQRPYI